MAKGNKNSALFFSSILVLSLLLIISMAESRILGTGFFAPRIPECDEVVGVESGDTCFDLAQTFNLTTALFDAINPNLNCTDLFVGQWLCVAGSA